MGREADTFLAPADWPEMVRRIRARTPARLLVGRAGAAYRTETLMELRLAHAAARDAVRAELDLKTTFSPEFVRQWKLFDVRTEAASKQEFLMRPDLGRRFEKGSQAELIRR